MSNFRPTHIPVFKTITFLLFKHQTTRNILTQEYLTKIVNIHIWQHPWSMIRNSCLLKIHSRVQQKRSNFAFRFIFIFDHRLEEVVSLNFHSKEDCKFSVFTWLPLKFKFWKRSETQNMSDFVGSVNFAFKPFKISEIKLWRKFRWFAKWRKSVGTKIQSNLLLLSRQLFKCSKHLVAIDFYFKQSWVQLKPIRAGIRNILI
jgi:hypothetical protein